MTPDNHGHRVPRPGIEEDEETLGESSGREMASKKRRTIKWSKRAGKNSNRRAESLESDGGRDGRAELRPLQRSQAESSRSGKAARALSRSARFQRQALAQNLAPEDCVVQSMPEVSPTKWHLAHTTWFFETFVVKKWMAGLSRRKFPEYAYLFNSYYNAAGDMHRRDLRGLISRPTVEETKRFRASIDNRT